MKMIVSFLLTALLLAGTVHAKQLPEVNRIIEIGELTEEVSKVLITGAQPDTALKFPEGASIPLHFLFNYSVAAIAYDPAVSIQVKETCYLRIVGKKAYMSTDLIDWKRPNKFFDGRLDGSAGANPHKLGLTVELVEKAE